MSATPGDAQRDESRDFPYWQRNLKAVPAATFLCTLGFSIVWPFLPLMVRSLGVHDDIEMWIGNMMLAFYVITFIANPIWGGIADHFGRKIMVLRAMLGMGVLMALIPFAPTPLWFAFLFILVGVFNGTLPAVNALVVGTTPPHRVGGALALTHTGALIGQTIGPALGALLAALIAQRHWLFGFSAALVFGGGLLVMFLVREVKQRVAGPWRSNWVGDLRVLLAVRHIGPLYFLGFMFAALWSGNVAIVSVYMLQLLEAHPAGADAYWVGAAAIGLAVAGAIALPLWGRLLDRTDAARMLAIATAGATLTTIPLAVLQTPLQLVLTRVAFGLAAAGMQPAIVQLLKKHAPAGMDARAISYGSAFGFIAMGIAPFAAGLIGPTLGLRWYYALNAALIAASLLLWLRSVARRS